MRPLLICVLFAALQSTSPRQPSWLTVEPLATPAALNSGQPQITVQGSRVILSWLEQPTHASTLKFSELTASGWSPAREVVSGHDLFVNNADTPSVRAAPDGTLAAQWLQTGGPDPEAYDLRLAFSKDSGRTWSAPVSPHHDGTQTQHGFASLFDAPGGGVGLIWLDGRNTAPSEKAAEGAMSLRASVYDKSGAQRSDVLVDPRVCDCCPTSTAVTSDGVIAAYRDRSTGDIRDIVVSRLIAGRWTAPAAVHRDGWQTNSCPVNGPSVSASGRLAVVGWFTMVKGAGQAFVAFSRDGGAVFAPPIRVDDTASLGRVQTAVLSDQSAAIGYIEVVDGRSHFRVRRVTASGDRSAAVTIAEGMGSQHPRMAVAGDALIMAWAENTRGTTRVRTARGVPTSNP